MLRIGRTICQRCGETIVNKEKKSTVKHISPVLPKAKTPSILSEKIDLKKKPFSNSDIVPYSLDDDAWMTRKALELARK